MRYNNDLLEALRQEGDPELDPIIVDLLDRGGLEQVNGTLRSALTNESAAPEALPPRLRAFLQKAAKLPANVDRTRMDRATAFFIDHGLSIAALLGLASLLECYAAKKGVKALHATDNMGYSGAEKRVGETAQFVLHAMTPGGLFEGGASIAVLLKVRMMHAASRALIRRLPDWNEKEDGVPINQEDLLATLMTFGYTPLVHLPKLGVQVTPEEAEDFLYFWCVAGELLGVRKDLLPRSVAEANEVLSLVQKRQWDACEEGKELTHSLFVLLARLVPGAGVFSGLVPGLARYIVGDHVCDLLAVPQSKWSAVFRGGQWMFRAVNVVQENSVTINRVVNRLGYQIMSGESMKVAGGKAEYRIPTELRRAWRMPPAGCGERAQQHARTLAQTLRSDATLDADTLLELATLVAAADGEVDAFEIETIAEFVEAFGLSSLTQEELRTKIEACAKHSNTHLAQAEELGARLHKSSQLDAAVQLAITIAYANSGLAPQERKVVEALGKGAKLPPLRLEQLVGTVAAAVDPRSL